MAFDDLTPNQKQLIIWLKEQIEAGVADENEGKQSSTPFATTGGSAKTGSMQQTLEAWAGTQHPTLAIVFTDVINSTALALSKGDPKWIDMILQHFKRGREVIAKYGGREIKLIGDSFMAVFRNAIAAFDFALELRHDTGHPEIKIRAGQLTPNSRINPH